LGEDLSAAVALATELDAVDFSTEAGRELRSIVVEGIGGAMALRYRIWDDVRAPPEAA
jgi:hypothetical protein